MIFYILLPCVWAVPVQITTGGQWKKLPDVVVYSATVPITYKMQWQTVEAQTTLMPVITNCNSTECSLERDITDVIRLTQQGLKHLTIALRPELWKETETTEEVPDTRRKRALDFIGDFFSFCCGIATERKVDSLKAQASEIHEFLRRMDLGLQKNLRLVTNNSKKFNDYHKGVTNNLIEIRKKITRLNDYSAKLSNEITKDHTKVERQLQLQRHQTYRIALNIFQITHIINDLDVMTSCKEHRIPSTVVHPDVLSADLLNLQQELSKDNHTLALSLSDISRYYKLEICDCTVTDGHLIIHIRIPIISKNRRWKLYELITTPFAWKNHTCLLMHETLYLAVASQGTKKALKSISGIGLHHCKPYTDKLCYLPRYNTDTMYGPQCAYKMFLGSTVQELEEHCSFRCHSSNSMIISEIKDDTFVITHPVPLTIISCPTSETPLPNISYNQPGALQISLPCQCSLKVNEEEVIAARYPCSKHGSQAPKTTHVLPAVWSNLKTYEIKSNEHNTVFHNINECLDNNWTTTVPHLNLTTSSALSEIVENLEGALSATYNDLYTYQGDTTYLIWNVILTTLVIILFYKLFKLNLIILIIPSIGLALNPEDKEILEQGLTYSKWTFLVLFCIILIILVLCYRCKKEVFNHSSHKVHYNPHRKRWLSVIPEESSQVEEPEMPRVAQLSPSCGSLCSSLGTEHVFIKQMD